MEDKSGFIDNRITILQAFKDGNLFGLSVKETQSMFDRSAMKDSIFCEDSNYRLPCLCVLTDDSDGILWVHSRARRLGLGRKLVELLNIREISNALPGSEAFWEKCNVKIRRPEGPSWKKFKKSDEEETSSSCSAEKDDKGPKK